MLIVHTVCGADGMGGGTKGVCGGTKFVFGVPYQRHQLCLLWFVRCLLCGTNGVCGAINEVSGAIASVCGVEPTVYVWN